MVRVADPRTGCPEGLQVLHPQRSSKPDWGQLWAASSGCLCSEWVGLADLQRYLPTAAVLWFCDSLGFALQLWK